MSISLDDVSMLAKTLIESEENIEKLELELKKAKERSRVLKEETIPGALQELGVEEIKMESGQKITIKQEIYGAITAANKTEAFQWLEKNGFGGLIKTSVETTFEKGQSESAIELLNELLQDGHSSSLNKNVHAQTLKAFLKEQISSGNNIPMELFSARAVFVAKIS